MSQLDQFSCFGFYVCILVLTQGEVSYKPNGDRDGYIRYFQFRSEQKLLQKII